MKELHQLLEWSQYERAISYGIIEDIDAGAVHRSGPVGGPHHDETLELGAREFSVVQYLDALITELIRLLRK
ncbi:hypothetical protein ACQKH5_01145 [Hyphomonas sp. NPDC076900]|uniref:hypothetical protein n=1 Tax=unclassified Hyphomonas TaxID=2630699 RepID=UPI003CFE4CD8